MPHPQKGHVAADQLEGWWVLAADVDKAAGGLASLALAMPAFFLGWIGLGVLVGLCVAGRGHHRPTMAAVGAGLGPLMVILAADMRRRAREARPLVLSPGRSHGGDLDLLVLIQEAPGTIRSVCPTLLAVESQIGTLTLARAVEYEWLDDPLCAVDNEVVAAAASDLRMARELVSIGNPALVLFPGTVHDAARGFTARPRRTLVLVAIDESVPTLSRW